MALSRLADKCIDSGRYGGIVRGGVANECERRILFLPLCLPFLFPSPLLSAVVAIFLWIFVFVLCFSPIGRSQVASLDASLSPSWRVADVTAGPLNGQRDKSFIWRSSSPPPTPSSPPPLCFLGRYAESLLAAVCVKGRKGGGEKKKKKKHSVCFHILSAPSLFWLPKKDLKKKRKKENPSTAVWLPHRHSQTSPAWRVVGDGDWGSVTPKFAKSPQPRVQIWEITGLRTPHRQGAATSWRRVLSHRSEAFGGWGGTRKDHAVRRWMTN